MTGLVNKQVWETSLYLWTKFLQITTVCNCSEQLTGSCLKSEKDTLFLIRSQISISNTGPEAHQRHNSRLTTSQEEGIGEER
jgi:hypothetical protein